MIDEYIFSAIAHLENLVIALLAVTPAQNFN